MLVGVLVFRITAQIHKPIIAALILNLFPPCWTISMIKFCVRHWRRAYRDQTSRLLAVMVSWRMLDGDQTFACWWQLVRQHSWHIVPRPHLFSSSVRWSSQLQRQMHASLVIQWTANPAQTRDLLGYGDRSNPVPMGTNVAGFPRDVG